MVWSSGGRNGVNVEWCRWANAARVLCSVVQTIAEQPYDHTPRGARIIDVARLYAVNFDGGEPLTLVDREWTSVRFGPRQNRLVSLTPHDETGVLVELIAYPRAIRMADGEIRPSGAPSTVVYRVDM